MIEYNLDNVSNKAVICEIHRRVLELADGLGIEPPPVKDEMARVLGPNGLIACHPINRVYYPEWLKKDMDSFSTTALQFLENHEEVALTPEC